MDMEFFRGIKFGLGIVLVFSVLFGLTYAVGFHIPDEIVSGTFNNDYSFNGSLNFTNANITGLSSIPSGFVGSFNLASCPSGWLTSDGTSGTVDLRGKFVRGLDLGAGVDTGRTLGSYQVDDFKSHSHTINDVPSPTLGYNGAIDSSTTASIYDRNYVIRSTATTGGAETRPKNIALIYCQKQ